MEPDYAQIDGYVETETGCDDLDNDCDGEVDEEREVDGWICVTPGRFFMGSPEDDDLGASRQNEPYHEVELTRGFWIKATEVTRAEWREAMAEQDETPRESIFEACGDDCPIDTLTRHEGIAYCNAVSVPEDRCYQDPDDGSDYSLEDARLGIEPAWPDGLDCLGVRLPTEAEWEYAARAGTEGWLYCDDPVDGPDWLDKLDTLAWYCANSGAHYPTPGACGCDAEPDTGFCGIQPVGRKLPNPWGLFDVLGNVEEWVWDLVTWYYGVWDPEPVVDPIGVGQQIPWRVAVRRGGHYNHRPEYCRMAARTLGSAPRFGVGMRPVRTIPVRGQ